MQIKTNNLVHIFEKGGVNEFKALDKVNVEIKQGEFITIIGKTGSGKTTFIEHLNALLKPVQGSVEYISDELVKELHDLKVKTPGGDLAFEIKGRKKHRKIKGLKYLRKHVGVVFQFAEYQLFEETIEKDIIFGPISMGTPKDKAKELAAKYLEEVGLDKSYLQKSPFSLSGGQKRRVALAGILAMEPEFLVFDEPTAGLDPQGEIDMYEIFTKLHEQGKTIIIVTHNLDHALEYSDRTILFKDGQVVKDGKTIDILYNQKLLEDNELEIPKLVNLVNILKKNGKKIGKINTIAKLKESL